MAKKKKASSSKKKTRFKLPKFDFNRQQRIIFGSLLILLGLALLVSFSSYFFTWKSDQSTLVEFIDRNAETKNLLSKFGASVSHLFIYKGFGIASMIFAFLIMLTGLSYLLESSKTNLKKRWFWGILIATWIATLLGFFNSEASLLSGTIGYEANDFLQDYIGKTGTLLLLIFGFVIYAVLRLQLTPEKITSFFKKTKEDVIQDITTEENTSKTPSEEIPENTEITTAFSFDTTEKQAEEIPQPEIVDVKPESTPEITPEQKQEEFVIT